MNKTFPSYTAVLLWLQNNGWTRQDPPKNTLNHVGVNSDRWRRDDIAAYIDTDTSGYHLVYED
jgi:hypothetical protein